MSKHSVKTYYESGRAEVRPADTTEELLDIMTECYSLQGGRASGRQAYRLDEVHRQLEYLALPVRYSGQLHLQENGRYKLGEYELTSGSSVEVLLYDEWEEVYKWVASRIEHNGESYYLVGHTDTALEGLKARKRG